MSSSNKQDIESSSQIKPAAEVVVVQEDSNNNDDDDNNNNNNNNSVVTDSNTNEQEYEQDYAYRIRYFSSGNKVVEKITLPSINEDDVDNIQCYCNKEVTKENSNADDSVIEVVDCPICFQPMAMSNNNKEEGENVEEQVEVIQDDEESQQQQIVSTKAIQLPCGHKYCYDCLREHAIHNHNSNSNNIPLSCPNKNDRVQPCNSYIQKHIVKNLLLPEQYKRYIQLYRQKIDPNIYECPICNELLIITNEDNNNDNDVNDDEDNNNNNNNNNDTTNDICCPSCDTIFCKEHGTVHINMSCETYMSTQSVQKDNTDATISLLQQYTKPCSHCGCHIQKSSGCDHVICISCHNDLCWKCGTHIYLTGTMVRHCSKCKCDYRDHRYDNQYRCRLCIFLPFLLPLILFYIATTIAIALCTGCFAGCFHCGRCIQQQNDNTNEKNSNNNNSNSNNDNNNTKNDNNNNNSPEDNHDEKKKKKKANNNNNRNKNDKNNNGSTCMKGFWTGFLIIFLPIIVILEDFGIHLQFLDNLFPEPINEMPVMDVATTVPTAPTLSDNEE